MSFSGTKKKKGSRKKELQLRNNQQKQYNTTPKKQIQKKHSIQNKTHTKKKKSIRTGGYALKKQITPWKKASHAVLSSITKQYPSDAKFSLLMVTPEIIRYVSDGHSKSFTPHFYIEFTKDKGDMLVRHNLLNNKFLNGNHNATLYGPNTQHSWTSDNAEASEGKEENKQRQKQYDDNKRVQDKAKQRKTSHDKQKDEEEEHEDDDEEKEGDANDDPVVVNDIIEEKKEVAVQHLPFDVKDIKVSVKDIKFNKNTIEAYSSRINYVFYFPNFDSIVRSSDDTSLVKYRRTITKQNLIAETNNPANEIKNNTTKEWLYKLTYSTFNTMIHPPIIAAKTAQHLATVSSGFVVDNIQAASFLIAKISVQTTLYAFERCDAVLPETKLPATLLAYSTLLNACNKGTIPAMISLSLSSFYNRDEDEWYTNLEKALDPLLPNLFREISKNGVQVVVPLVLNEIISDKSLLSSVLMQAYKELEGTQLGSTFLSESIELGNNVIPAIIRNWKEQKSLVRCDGNFITDPKSAKACIGEAAYNMLRKYANNTLDAVADVVSTAIGNFFIELSKVENQQVSIIDDISFSKSETQKRIKDFLVSGFINYFISEVKTTYIAVNENEEANSIDEISKTEQVALITELKQKFSTIERKNDKVQVSEISASNIAKLLEIWVDKVHQVKTNNPTVITQLLLQSVEISLPSLLEDSNMVLNPQLLELVDLLAIKNSKNLIASEYIKIFTKLLCYDTFFNKSDYTNCEIATFMYSIDM